jgi:hypothetical protein
MTTAAAMGAVMASVVLCGPRAAGAVTARWRYEAAYPNVNGGDWYRDVDNETATLAWGESYVLMSLCAMFRATGDPLYLERLTYHLDGVLAQRDDARGVTDYRGVSTACWRNTHYQPNDEPYCYVVHSGMLGYNLAEFARLVEAHGLHDELAHDGVTTLGDKADAYITAAEETVACHDDQWDSAGYYVFRSDATFLAHAGEDLPLNQSNAMGRMLLVLYDVTGNTAYLDKATALAQRFAAFLSTGAHGEYLWNYWGGNYSAPGEDISHAAINVGFAALAADYGVVFDGTDLEAFARTFVYNVYQDDHTFADRVGGGGTNSYAVQSGRWVHLTPQRATVYAAVRDLFEMSYPPAAVGSGSVLAGWGYLAEYEPLYCPHFFYYVDWYDPDPQNDGDWREATAYGANILTAPVNLDQPCMIPLAVDAPRAVTVSQWDGADYHPTVRWQASGGATTRHVPYEPRWPYLYWNGGVLFQFEDAFVSGNGILVQENPGLTPPQITSTPPNGGLVNQPLVYTAQAIGETPLWWSLTEFPVHARIDAATGALTFTPAGPGPHDFTVRVENDVGADEQSFTYFAADTADGAVEDGAVDGAVDGGLADGSSDTGTTAADGAGGDTATADTSVANDAQSASDASALHSKASGGCGCRSHLRRHSAGADKDPGPAAWPEVTAGLLLLLLLCWLLARARRFAVR